MKKLHFRDQSSCIAINAKEIVDVCIIYPCQNNIIVGCVYVNASMTVDKRCDNEWHNNVHKFKLYR